MSSYGLVSRLLIGRLLVGRLLMIVSLSALLMSCQNLSDFGLPNEPHSPSSQAFTQAVYDLYADKDLSVDKSVADKSVADKSVKVNVNADVATHNQGQGLEVPTLTQSITQLTLANPNRSGYLSIIEGNDAMATRTLLSRQASKSIDVQYYIWHNDEAGQWLLHELWLAAERGVKVRLLLDDFNITANIDELLWYFDQHPNIAVRIINPMVYRNWRGLNYVADFKRVNRRMHNKSMTYDRQLSIIGGRNIGNEYLSDHNANQFADLDVLLVGNVVDDVVLSFEWFWQSQLSYDVSQLLNKPVDKQMNKPTNQPSNNQQANLDTDLVTNIIHNKQGFIKRLDLIKDYLDKYDDAQLAHKITKILAQANDSTLIGDKTGGELDSKFRVPPQQTDKSRHANVKRLADDAVNQSSVEALPTLVTPSPIEALQNSISKINLMQRLDKQALAFKWADMQYISDVPQKLDNTAPTDTYIIHMLQKMIKEPKQKLSIISSYFVPTKQGVDMLVKLAERGVDIAILTNSYGATDVAVVHSGYAPWRKQLLKAGVRLYELKPTKAERGNFFKPPSVATTSLHAKSFATDDEQIFIGSFNFDPRSALLNTELGVVIHAPTMVKDMHQTLTDTAMQDTAYILSLDEQDDIHWRTIDATTGNMVTYDIEPNMGIFDHVFVMVLSWLPIEWLL